MSAWPMVPGVPGLAYPRVPVPAWVLMPVRSSPDSQAPRGSVDVDEDGEAVRLWIGVVLLTPDAFEAIPGERA